jgi:hypothetical protein
MALSDEQKQSAWERYLEGWLPEHLTFTAEEIEYINGRVKEYFADVDRLELEDQVLHMKAI